MKKLVFALLAIGLLAGCAPATALTRQEKDAFLQIAEAEFSEDISEKLKELASESIVKAYRAGAQYGFVVAAKGRNAAIWMAVVIENKLITGARIYKQEETPHYVRDYADSAWFMDRFANKSTDLTLKLVKLEVEAPEDIVAISGATVTTQAVIDGINDAMAAYNALTE